MPIVAECQADGWLKRKWQVRRSGIASPLKHAMRDLNEEFKNLPSEDALADCARDTVLKDELLKKAGLLKARAASES